MLYIYNVIYIYIADVWFYRHRRWDFDAWLYAVILSFRACHCSMLPPVQNPVKTHVLAVGYLTTHLEWISLKMVGIPANYVDVHRETVGKVWFAYGLCGLLSVGSPQRILRGICWKRCLMQKSNLTSSTTTQLLDQKRKLGCLGSHPEKFESFRLVFFWDSNLIYLFILFFFRESLSTNSIGCSSCCWTSCACMGWALIVWATPSWPHVNLHNPLTGAHCWSGAPCLRRSLTMAAMFALPAGHVQPWSCTWCHHLHCTLSQTDNPWRGVTPGWSLLPAIWVFFSPENGMIAKDIHISMEAWNWTFFPSLGSKKNPKV